MGQKEKLIARLKTISKDFTFDEAEALLGYLSYSKSNKGKTRGSRVMFVSDQYQTNILLHKPHPRKELAEYQESKSMEELADLLEVMSAVAAARGSSMQEVEAIRQKKKEKRGGFEKRILLEEVLEENG